MGQSMTPARSAFACERLITPALDAGNPAAALSYALSACQTEFELGCFRLVDHFGYSRDYTDAATGNLIVIHACKMGHSRACLDAYRAEFASGHHQRAREQFGRLCVDQRNVRACRYAAQFLRYSQFEP